MTLHIFGAIITHHGTAANNRGETEGNTTTLQKLVWKGQVHSSVSAEAIRFALRRQLALLGEVNRKWNEDERRNEWADSEFRAWADGGAIYLDDDLLGFMSAKAAGTEAEAAEEPEENGGAKKKKERKKGKAATARRAVLEISRAVSLVPWAGDVTFNAASPGATPSAQRKGINPVPYATELHATRYQYSFALTPDRLREKDRAAMAIRALTALGPVAGNHGRFLYDFSPESLILRITEDAAPRILYVFEERGSEVEAPSLLQRVDAGDIKPTELILGGSLAKSGTGGELAKRGAKVLDGVKSAAEEACARIAAA